MRLCYSKNNPYQVSKTIVVIGAGFAGLSSATCLAAAGHKVVLLEKNSVPGGRARKFEKEGFVFDMGPSWYWMPEVFDNYFGRFGKKTSDYYELVRLDPSYRIYFNRDDIMDVPAGIEELGEMFERYEPGSSKKLNDFLNQAAYKYRVGMDEFVFKPGHNLLEFADTRVFSSLLKLQMLQSMRSHVHKLFKHPQLRELLEFPVLFLGATPQNTPAMYSLMNYADLKLGTWYPMGGMHKIIEGMVSLAQEKGVEIHLDTEVKQIVVPNGHITEVITEGGAFQADFVVGAADYHHVEQQLLPERSRRYDAAYWDNRTMAPSSLLYYLGIDKKIDGLKHHNLFFDADFNKHAREIYEAPAWPSNPLFYACCPSRTDGAVAPEGKENLFLLMPLAPDLEDTEEKRDKYFHLMMERLEAHLGTEVRPYISFKRSYAHRDFKSDYHAFKGNAYGLANTLRQTAFLKPKMRSNKVSNLYYAGQLTTPGPGVPPSLISGQVVASEIDKYISRNP